MRLIGPSTRLRKQLAKRLLKKNRLVLSVRLKRKRPRSRPILLNSTSVNWKRLRF
jgi:hypothetical protein